MELGLSIQILADGGKVFLIGPVVPIMEGHQGRPVMAKHMVAIPDHFHEHYGGQTPQPLNHNRLKRHT